MLNVDDGITTNAGIDLLNRCEKGDTKIRWTKIVYSSSDLSDLSVDDLKQLTDIPNQELAGKPQVVLKPKTSTSDQEVELQITLSNKSLDNGYFVNCYGVYAEDDDDNKILYGVAVDNHPSYLPAYDHVREQELTYEWDSALNSTDNVHFTDTHDAYITRYDFNQAISAVDSDINNTQSSQDNLASTVADNSNTASSAMAESFSDATSYASSFAVSLASNDASNSAGISQNYHKIMTAFNQLGINTQANSEAVDSLTSNVSDVNSTAVQANNNASALATGNAEDIQHKFIKFMVAFNQVGTNAQNNSNAVDSLANNVSDANAMAVKADNDASSYATGNADDLRRKFYCLLALCNQLGTENVQLRSELLN